MATPTKRTPKSCEDVQCPLYVIVQFRLSIAARLSIDFNGSCNCVTVKYFESTQDSVTWYDQRYTSGTLRIARDIQEHFILTSDFDPMNIAFKSSMRRYFLIEHLQTFIISEIAMNHWILFFLFFYDWASSNLKLQTS